MLNLFNHVAARWGFAAAYRVMAWAPLLALVAGLAAGAWLGWSQGRAPLQVQLAQLHQAHAETARLQALASARALQAAHLLGNQLTHRLAASERQRHQLTQEKTHAIQQVTTGRTCLDGAALSVLHGAPGLSVQHADQLPPAPSGPAAAHAPVATDTGVANWAIAVGSQYQTCADRIQALIDWDNNTAGSPQP